MDKSDFKTSLKDLVVDEKRALSSYREMLDNRYNVTSSSYSNSSDGESSGNIQEIGHEEKDDEFEL